MRKPPAKAGPGRPKGLPNKLTRDVREMVREALTKAGGVAYLQRQAIKNPRAFLTLVAKLMPAEIAATIRTRHSIDVDWHALLRPPEALSPPDDVA